MATANIQDVSMTYSSALDIAKAIDDKRLDFNGMRGTLDNLVDRLNGQWEGAAQREFLTAYNKLKPKLKLISETMERYSQEIRATVKAEQEADNTSSTGFRGLDSWFGQPVIGSLDRGKKNQGPSLCDTRKEGMSNNKCIENDKTNHAAQKNNEQNNKSSDGREKRDNHELCDDPPTNKEIASRLTVLDEDHILSYSSTDGKMIAKKGYITYVDQYNKSNGWGARWGDHTWECCTACQSMALSYLGISKTPEELLNTYEKHDNGCRREVRGTPEATQSFRWGWNQEDFSAKLEAFESDGNQGKTSPVLIHYQYSGSMHWVMVVGRESDNTYRVIGPVGSFASGGSEKNAVVKIEDGQITCIEGKLSGLTDANIVGRLDGMVQYYSN